MMDVPMLATVAAAAVVVATAITASSVGCFWFSESYLKYLPHTVCLVFITYLVPFHRPPCLPDGLPLLLVSRRAVNEDEAAEFAVLVALEQVFLRAILLGREGDSQVLQVQEGEGVLVVVLVSTACRQEQQRCY